MIRHLPLTAALCVALTLSAGAALAQTGQLVVKIFGHEVAVIKEPGNDRLKLDDAIVLEAGRIDILDIDMTGDVPYAIGWTGSGGSMCGSVPFVINFAPTPATIDVSPLECMWMEPIEENGTLRFVHPVDARPMFLWTPDAGFTAIDN